MRLAKVVLFCFLGVFLIACPASASYPLKILGLFPHPGISHFEFFRPIMRGLAESGHDVTVVSHFPDKSPPVRYKDLILPSTETLMDTVDLKTFEKRHFYDGVVEFFLLNQWGKDACNLTLRSDALAQVMRQKGRYDVIIVEQFNSDCMMGVAHMLKAPVIALSSCALMPWHYRRFGMPTVPSHIPVTFLGYSEQMTFGQRFLNWIYFHGMNLLYDVVTTPAIDAMVQYKFGHDVPSVGELAKDTAMMFVNQHFSLSGPKPLPPSVIELGGIHIQKAKPLPAELQRFLDNAENGVIFISWGSMIRAESMPLAKRDAILKAAKRLKQRFVWKWENETLPDQPENMYISKWLPQRDILCHPNVKVFMSHSGLMGSSEAAYCGVPIVATPMYGDQFLNAAALVSRGMATLLPYSQITENNVIKAIKQVLEKKYVDNAKAVSHTYNHRPQTALQTALWWVEYVAKTEGAPLTKSASVYMSRIEYYNLDVYLLLGVFLGLTIYGWVLMIRKIFSRAQIQEKIKIH